MSDTAPENLSSPAPTEMQAALFAQLVMQQTNMAMLLLGKTPHPQTGQKMRDLDGAGFFISQLEMLEAKTKGNLSRDESALLKQNLMALRMAFVEAVNEPPPAAPASEAAPAEKDSGPEAAAESAKRFSKKY